MGDGVGEAIVLSKEKERCHLIIIIHQQGDAMLIIPIPLYVSRTRQVDTW